MDFEWIILLDAVYCRCSVLAIQYKRNIFVSYFFFAC
jgi:hypothetical protein